METLVRAQVVGCSPVQSRTSRCLGCHASSAQCGRSGGHKLVALRVLDRPQLRQRFESIRRPVCGSSNRASAIRASGQSGSNVDDIVREITSDEAVEGPETVDRNANVKADELKSEGETEETELPVAAELLLSALKAEDDNSETVKVEQDAALDVASASAVDDPKAFFEDVNDEAKAVFIEDVNEEAKTTAVDLGRSVEEEAATLETKAEELGDRQATEGDLVKKLDFDEDDGKFDGEFGDGTLPSTRGEAEQKFVDTARDGYEVLKWAAEGIVSAGQNASGNLEVAKEALNKRLKSFGIAADETKDISSQAKDVAQDKFGTIRGSTSKFGEELQVNIEEKKAAESLKPESERSLGTQVTQQIQENYAKVTAEDGPLAQLSESLSENFSKASEAGREFTTRVSEKAAELTDKSKGSTEELTDKAKGSTEELTDKAKGSTEELTDKAKGRTEELTDKAKGSTEELTDKAKSSTEEFSSSVQKKDASEAVVSDYEDERGNELLKGQVTAKDETVKFDADKPQVLPSKKQDDSDIGPDE